MAHVFAAPRGGSWPRYLTFARDGDAIAALDGLRAFAILLVLARHAVTPLRSDGQMLLPVFGWDAATPLINGWIGVDLFFVLSGFLISRGLIRRNGHVGGIRLGRYFARRAMRILPAYYAVLGVAVAGWIPFFAVDADLLGLRVIYHALFLQDYLPSNIVIAFWSLGVEEKFYIAAPFVLVPLLRANRRGLQYGIIAALILTPLAFRLNLIAGGAAVVDYETFFRTIRSPFHRGFDGLAVGVLVALLWRDRTRYRWISNPHAAFAIFWTGIAVAGGFWLATPMLDTIGLFDRSLLQLVLAAGFGAVVLGALMLDKPERRGAAGLLGAPALRPVAILSYSLYLVHMTVIPAAFTLSEGLNTAIMGRSFPNICGFIGFYIGFSVLAALILHFAVEKPFLMRR